MCSPKLFCTFLFIALDLFFYSSSLQNSCNNIKDFGNLFRGNSTKRNFDYTVGIDYVSSAQWIFKRNYLTVAIDKNENGLTEPDCDLG